MLEKLVIDGVHFSPDEDLHKYVVKKIGKLDQYMSRHVRQSAHGEVKLKETKLKNRSQATCEVILHLPQDIITTKETTLNMYAAIDIVEAKLKNQLKHYKDKHSVRFHRRLLAKIKHQPS